MTIPVDGTSKTELEVTFDMEESTSETVLYGKMDNMTNNDNANDNPTTTSKNEEKTTSRKQGTTPPQTVKKPPVGTSSPSLAKVFKLSIPELPMLVLSFCLMIISESTELIIPLFVAAAYDTLVDEDITDNEERLSEINHIMTVVLLVYGAGLMLGFVQSSIMGVVGERMVARLRYQLYESILKQEIAFFDEHKSGELVSRLGSDTTLLQTIISSSIPEAVLGIIQVLVSIVLMFYLSPKLAGVSIGGVFFVFIIAAPMGSYLGTLSKRYQDLLGEAQTHSTEAFGSMRTVQAFAAESKEVKRFGRKIGNPDDCPWWWPSKESSTYRHGFFRAITSEGFDSIIYGGGFGFLYVSLWYGFYLVSRGELTLGDLTAFQSYIFIIGFGLGNASSHIANILEGLGASGRIFYLLECVPKIPKPREDDNNQNNQKTNIGMKLVPLTPSSMTGNIEFRNVDFAYPSRPDFHVLQDFTLSIPANTTTALVGSSGAGKSTVVSLLQRFYDSTDGTIFVDGVDIQDLNLQWLRHKIGYVEQEPQLFGLTIRENLLYGIDDDFDNDRGKVTQEELEQACKDANAHDFIMTFPDGYDTLVGERGVKVSGGQKQRIAIARALLTDCRILLLDEATSALDAEAEHLVQEAIDKAVVGRTVIIIAHRLSTIQRADQIVVMDKRRIVQVGTHDELVSGCRKYQDLIKRQSMISRDVSLRGVLPNLTVSEEFGLPSHEENNEETLDDKDDNVTDI